MEKTFKTKDEFRKMIRERRGQASPADISRDSEIIFHRIREMDEYIIAGSVYCYVDFSNEVRTRDFMEAAFSDGKMVAVPRVDPEKKTMDFYYIDSLKELKEGAFGIPEPKKGCEKADSASALLIVPGLAFDLELNRIGQGGGYYDRYIRENPWHMPMAVAFEFQLFDEVPHEETDVRPEYLVTESRVLKRAD